MKPITCKLFLLILTTVSFLVISCKQVEPVKSQISKVELATNGEGKLPRRAISIDSTLLLKFYTDTLYTTSTNPVYPRYYEGKVTQTVWDSLTQKLAQVHYNRLNAVDSAELRINDVIGVELFVNEKGKSKRIERGLSMQGTPLNNLIGWILKLPRQVQLRETSIHEYADTVHFSTTFQNKHFLGE
ncbi:hypothetical protein [Mucilaginibacter sp.]